MGYGIYGVYIFYRRMVSMVCYIWEIIFFCAAGMVVGLRWGFMDMKWIERD